MKRVPLAKGMNIFIIKYIIQCNTLSLKTLQYQGKFNFSVRIDKHYFTDQTNETFTLYKLIVYKCIA